ncbi:hypothetical protein [Cypionkella sp.]|uniref:hypothetical protein n=1 Tax=Cypionkella sp. TaxID=2811411 RepID=UPI002ABBCA5D|nr:hypothetical protein [Cypionkella sp.]MDZ4392278.1 hypothetical protein [Cypionkella sp.]
MGNLVADLICPSGRSSAFRRRSILWAALLIPAVFVLAGFVGLINVLVITRLNVHPIIATLAIQYIMSGITRILRAVSGGKIPDIVIAAVQGSFLDLSLPLFWGLFAIELTLPLQN